MYWIRVNHKDAYNKPYYQSLWFQKSKPHFDKDIDHTKICKSTYILKYKKQLIRFLRWFFWHSNLSNDYYIEVYHHKSRKVYTYGI